MYTVKLLSLKLKKKLTRFDKLRFAHEVSPRVKEIKKYESGLILFTEQKQNKHRLWSKYALSIKFVSIYFFKKPVPKFTVSSSLRVSHAGNLG